MTLLIIPALVELVLTMIIIGCCYSHNILHSFQKYILFQPGRDRGSIVRLGAKTHILLPIFSASARARTYVRDCTT